MPTNSIIISAINAFTDNYIWAIQSKSSALVTLVDPGDASVCIDFIEQNKLQLHGILITHHHADHTGGVTDLIQYCANNNWSIFVAGPTKEKIPHCDTKLNENETIEVLPGELTLSVIEVPGHTSGHIAYYADNILFCGDTLFSGGCGRIFEGTSEQMFNSLEKLSSLPDSTKVYCTHEYTLANLNFALAVEPSNFDLINYYNQVTNLRAQNINTLPSTIEQEKRINPFLRCHIQEVKESGEEYSAQRLNYGQQTFATIREWKNNF